MAKKTIHDSGDLSGKRVLIRVDFNVPLKADGTITNDRRIRAALPTIRYVLNGGGSAIVMSHLGRPGGDPKKDAPITLDRVAERLRQLLGGPVKKSNEVVGPEVESAARNLNPGEVLVLENLRFHPGEQSGDIKFARQLAALGDVYVNDAFGTCHRSDASMVAVPKVMAEKPRVVGFLVAKELDILGQLLSSPRRPFVGILGGAKVSDKIGFIKCLIARVDRVLIGGAMTYTFMKARGRRIGGSKMESDKLDVARELLSLGGNKIILPADHLVVQKLEAPEESRVVEGDIPDGWIGVDIGPITIALYQKEIASAGMVVWNGPMGKYEDQPYSRGTRSIGEALVQSKATTIVGGGETADAVEEFGLADQLTHVSTGGGAFLEYVAGTPLPTLEQIENRN
ncbi:MAG TPA: phosphoglycerate kinase [Gemmataceae bacterium]|nr:phosphoglycerate kinase [Gemmataceae bacterium]